MYPQITQKRVKPRNVLLEKLKNFVTLYRLPSLLTHYQKNSSIKGKIKTNGHFDNTFEVNGQKRQN